MIRPSILILSIVTCGLSAIAQTKPASDTVCAQRDILVELPNARQQKLQLLLLNRPDGGVSEVTRAAADALGIPPAEADDVVDLRTEDGYVRIEIDLRKSKKTVAPRAAEAADRATDAARQILERSARELPVQLFENLQRMRNELQQKREELLKETDKQQAELRAKTRSIDVSPATVRQLLFSLQTQHESAEIDLVAKQARSDALAEQIAKFSDQLKAKIKDDPIAAELEKVVKFKEETYRSRQAMQASGAGTQAEASEAMSAVAEAKAKYLERREQAAAAAGGDVIAGWNRELMTLSVEMAELKARLKAVADRLDRFSDAAEIINHSDQRQQALADVGAQLLDVEKRLLDAQTSLREPRVNISVVGANNIPATQPAK